MRKFLTAVLASLAVMVGAGAMSSSALAANSTCVTHVVFSAGTYVLPSRTLIQDYDFKCGGANNEGYSINSYEQFQNASGVWVTATCASTDSIGTQADCYSWRPSNNPYFDGGTEHSGEQWFDLKEGVNSFCSSDGSAWHKFWREHVVISFAGSSPNIVYNGGTTAYPAGTC